MCRFRYRPPMLDRTDFASWQQRSRLYCRGKENGVNILKSMMKDLFIWENLVELCRRRHMGQCEDAPGSTKGEDYSCYYVRGCQLINDMRNIKMTMSRMQLNSKFVNNMLSEWDRFATVVKLNRGLRDSNYDQLYAYLKQHEAHANENKMLLDRLTQHTVDPLALMTNVAPQQYNSQSSTNPSSTYVPPHFADNSQLDSRLSPTNNLIENLTNTLALLTQSYKTYLPQTNNQLRTSSNPKNQATIQDGRVVVQNVQGRQNKGHGNNARGAGTAGYGGALNRVGNANPGQARQVKCYNYNAQENGVALDEEQLLFLAGGQDNAVDEDVDEQPNPVMMKPVRRMIQTLSEVHDHDHYQDAVCEHHEEHEMHDDVQPNYVVDSHADYTSNSNMIPYDQYVKDNAVPVSVSKTTRNIVVDNSLTAELETYKEQVELYERRARFELTKREQKIDEQLRIVITDRNIKEENLKKELQFCKLQLASTINHNKSMVEEVTSLKKDFKQKENKYLEEFLDMKALKEKVTLGYNGPLCLTVQSKLACSIYEIVKNNHVPAIVHNTKDTLEIAEIIRRKMHDKMKDPECVTHKVTIAPPDYSKENYLATFTPQKQLTTEKIFWSQDIIKMKAKALKEQTSASRPTKALTVYPLNTPATLIPRVLPTKSQVKINIFALTQLFLDFEKTCNKRITPTGLTEGEKGFEQTNACYLTEVIPFFKTLKEHFEGIQKALTKEVKEMKEIFKELEAEVDQHVIDKKHDEIERKNLLSANDNLIADCLFKDVFHVATNFEINVSSFIEMHDAHTSLKARCLELEVELSNLRDKIQKDNHDELIKLLKHLEQTTALLTDNDSLKVQIQNKLSCVNKDHVKPKVLAPGKYAIDVEPIPPRNRNNREVHLVYLKHLKESVETLREIVEEAKVERPLDSSLASAYRYTKCNTLKYEVAANVNIRMPFTLLVIQHKQRNDYKRVDLKKRLHWINKILVCYISSRLQRFKQNRKESGYNNCPQKV
ncbi:hypothetical protein Tco_0532880 [Tanacetum coccineum]